MKIYHPTALVSLTLLLTTSRTVCSFTIPSVHRHNILTTGQEVDEQKSSIFVNHAKAVDEEEGSRAETFEPDSNSRNRRGVLASLNVAALLPFCVGSPSPASAAAAAGKAPSIVSPKDVLFRLRPVPTFSIVNPAGIPYMIVSKDNQGGIGYFFTSFGGAKKVLDDAKKGADEAGYPETWEGATVMTVPMDVALRLAVQKKNAKAKTIWSWTPFRM